MLAKRENCGAAYSGRADFLGIVSKKAYRHLRARKLIHTQSFSQYGRIKRCHNLTDRRIQRKIKPITIVAELFIIGFGVFLVLDSFVLHLLYFDYPRVQLGWLDSLLNHWMIGVVLVGVGVYALHLSLKEYRDLQKAG